VGIESRKMYYLAENGIEKRIETWKVIVPLHDNDNKEFPEELINSVKTKVINEFGGLTAVNAVGQWQSGRELYTDRNIQVIVDVPIKDHKETTSFFLSLKGELRKELRQHKIYVTFESGATELLSVNEFLQELGFEVNSNQRQLLTQYDVQRLIEQSDKVQKRLGYRTLSLIRNNELKCIIWEREILGTKIITAIEDKYPPDTVIFSADNLEEYFKEDTFGKPLVVIGSYEYQLHILDNEKRRYITGHPSEFSAYDQGNKEPIFFHTLYGALKTSEFIPIYLETLLVDYIILRELGIKGEEIAMIVSSDGIWHVGGGCFIGCNAYLPIKKILEPIIKGYDKVRDLYENGAIDEISLMQLKMLYNYKSKKEMFIGYRKYRGQGTTDVKIVLPEFKVNTRIQQSKEPKAS